MAGTDRKNGPHRLEGVRSIRRTRKTVEFQVVASGGSKSPGHPTEAPDASRPSAPNAAPSVPGSANPHDDGSSGPSATVLFVGAAGVIAVSVALFFLRRARAPDRSVGRRRSAVDNQWRMLRMRTSDRHRPGRVPSRAWVGILAIVLLGACGSSGDVTQVRPTSNPASSDPAHRGFVVRYEELAPDDRKDASFLRSRRPMEIVAEALDTFVDPGREMSVVGRSCNGEGSAYDPETRRIEVCYDDVADERALFERAGRRPADDEVVAVMIETLYHEAGHALVDVLNLPSTIGPRRTPRTGSPP